MRKNNINIISVYIIATITTTNMFQRLIGFSEPNYPIVTRERFDEDVIKSIIADEAYSVQDRKTTSAYYKRKNGAGETNVIYQFGEGCEEHKLGRLFAQNNLGMANWTWTIRNPLAKKNYWDIDIANAHYKIALKYCERYDIEHAKLRDYCENRDERLKMVCPDNRERAKNEFLKTLYGDKPKDYGFYLKDVEGVITPEGYTYVKGLKAEVALLMQTIWDKHPQYHDLKTGKEKKQMKKKENHLASLMSLIFQTEERRMLMCLREYLTINKRYMGVFIHDGGYVEKLENEIEFPKELLEGGARMIKEFIGYDVKIENKEITHNWKPKKIDENSYAYKKTLFEKNNALVRATFVSTHEDGYVDFMSEREAKLKFANWRIMEMDTKTFEMKNVPFLEKYIADPTRTEYDRIDFNPNLNDAPKRIYNLFDGFEVEKIKDKIIVESKTTMREKIQPLIEHMSYLTSGYEEYLIKWLAFIIQFPYMKTQVSLLFRDQAGLLSEGGGTGKNQFFERLCARLIGEKYAYFVDDNNELYNSFNSLFEGKLLIFVEEASGKANHQNSDTLKSKITKKKTNVNKKSIAQYTVNDYCNYVFCTNNSNPIPISKGDRRWAVFDVNPEKRGNEEYFKNLISALEDDEVIQYFYHYLKYEVKTYKDSFELSTNVPDTEAYREIKFMNAPTHLKFLLSLLYKGEMKKEYYSRDLYEEYKLWYSENKPGKESEILTETSFGSILKKNDDEITLDNTRTAKGIKYSMDIPKIIAGLKKIKLLHDGFMYVPKAD
jgi:hypothetical protein